MIVTKKSGDPLRASEINELVAGIDGQRRIAQKGTEPGGERPPYDEPAAAADGVNDDSVDLKSLQPVELTDHYYSGVKAFSNRVFKIKMPTSAAKGKFAILAEATNQKYVGKVYLSGVCLARLQTASGDKYADISAGNDYLVGSPTEGAAEILWEDGGASSTTHNALIRFPRASSSGGNATARCAVTTTSDSHSGLTARDGVTPVDGDIIFDDKHATSSSRGLWVAHSGAWTRALVTISRGMLVTIREGTTRGNSVYFLDVNDDPIVLGTTGQTWTSVNGDTRWTEVRSFTATPTDSTHIAFSDTTGLTAGKPIRFALASALTTYYYAIIKAVTANTSIEILGPALSADIGAIWFGSPELVGVIDFFVPGLYAATTQDILANIAKTYFQWGFADASCVNYKCWSNTGGAGTAKVKLKNGSNSFDTNGVVPSTSGVDSAAIDATKYSVARGDSLEIGVTVTDATAKDLTIRATFVLK